MTKFVDYTTADNINVLMKFDVFDIELLEDGDSIWVSLILDGEVWHDAQLKLPEGYQEHKHELR